MSGYKVDFNDFKAYINLSEYAAYLGYVKDNSSSSKNSVTMRHSNGDKIIISKDINSDHYIYFSVRSNSDNGTIIDFVSNRSGGGWDNIIKELKPWLSQSKPIVNIKAYQKKINATKPDIATIINNISKMDSADNHMYLQSKRKISSSTLSSKRFKNKVLKDKNHNAVFPHYDSNGICGYEIRNFNFKGFSVGGKKSFWMSNWFKDDSKLIITESAIDSLSYYELFKNENHRFASTGGSSESEFLDTILIPTINNFKGDVLLAFDNDKGGDDLINTLKAKSIRSDLIIDRPKERGFDWNQALLESKG